MTDDLVNRLGTAVADLVFIGRDHDDPRILCADRTCLLNERSKQ